jgi:protein ATS1
MSTAKRNGQGLATELFAAGSNGRGQLATGDSQDVHTFTPCKFAGRESTSTSSPALSPEIISIVGGGNHTLALLSPVDRSTPSTPPSEVWVCGEGAKGQLGPAYIADGGRDDNEGAMTIFRPLILPLEEQGLSGYTISQVAACWETSFLVLTKPGQHDLLISMGGDDFGDLGIGGLRSKRNAKPPFHVLDFSHIVGSAPHARLSITSVTAGPHHAIALLSTDHEQHVVGWGTARHGQLGPLFAPSGRALPFSPSPVAIELPIDARLDPVLSVRAGNQHSLFLHTSGRVSALGSDAKGQLQGGLQTARDVRAIDCSWNGSYLRTPAGLLSAGANARGQLGRDDAGGAVPLAAARFPDGVQVLDFACGSEHVLALVESRGMTEVWGWGWNEHGNLGTGSLSDVNVPIKIWPAATAESGRRTDDAVCVWAGCGTSWIGCSKAN